MESEKTWLRKLFEERFPTKETSEPKTEDNMEFEVYNCFVHSKTGKISFEEIRILENQMKENK